MPSAGKRARGLRWNSVGSGPGLVLAPGSGLRGQWWASAGFSGGRLGASVRWSSVQVSVRCEGTPGDGSAHSGSRSCSFVGTVVLIPGHGRAHSGGRSCSFVVTVVLTPGDGRAHSRSRSRSLPVTVALAPEDGRAHLHHGRDQAALVLNSLRVAGATPSGAVQGCPAHRRKLIPAP